MSAPSTLAGIGIDLIDLERFTRLYGSDDPEILARCFTEAELDEIGHGIDRISRLAARFAAKEAAYKAMGGGEGVALTDICVLRGPAGAPVLSLTGAAQVLADSRGLTAFLVTLTHSDSAAAAVVVALSNGPT